MTRQFLLLLLPLAAAADGPAQPAPATLSGEVVLLSKANPKLRITSFKKLVVYLRAADGRELGAPAEQPEIRQRGARFNPPLLVIARGQTVLFPNDDDLYHNVFSYSPVRKFDLGLFKSGAQRAVRFDKAGVVRIHCSIHETMNATIVVADTRFHTQPLVGPGRFEFTGVPPGRYEVRTWHPRFPEGRTRIELLPGGKHRVLVKLGERDAQN